MARPNENGERPQPDTPSLCWQETTPHGLAFAPQSGGCTYEASTDPSNTETDRASATRRSSLESPTTEPASIVAPKSNDPDRHPHDVTWAAPSTR